MAGGGSGGVCYTGADVDRAEGLRKDPERLAAAFRGEEARFVVSRGGAFLVHDLVDPATGSRVLHARRDLADGVADDPAWLFLGVRASCVLFAVDLAAGGLKTPSTGDRTGFVDLRAVAHALGRGDAALLAYARGLLNWHRHNGFCSRCGARTVAREGGHRRKCLGPSCEAEHYPRTDPAVIMLVERPATFTAPAMCLLGRRHGWPASVYSTLAGYVEPGESLEEAVAREVWEEAGIAVETCRYQGSQPWPFPGSLMLGFRARAATIAITLDRDELADARWFTREALRTAGEWGDRGRALCLPRRDSIARFLLDGWLNQEA